MTSYEILVEWLEIPENLQLLIGRGKPGIGGQVLMKRQCSPRYMLVELHACGFLREINIVDNLGKWYNHYYKCYKEALAMKNDTRSRLTDTKLAARISFKEKLNKMCPHFEQMHIIYGNRANINPDALGVQGMVEHDEVYDE